MSWLRPDSRPSARPSRRLFPPKRTTMLRRRPSHASSRGWLPFQSHGRRLLSQQDDARCRCGCVLEQPESQHCPRGHLPRRLEAIPWGQYPSIGSPERHSRPAAHSVSKLLLMVGQHCQSHLDWGSMALPGFVYGWNPKSHDTSLRTNSSTVSVPASSWPLLHTHLYNYMYDGYGTLSVLINRNLPFLKGHLPGLTAEPSA